MNRKLLEQFVQQVVEQEIDELAVKPEHAAESGLALGRVEGSGASEGVGGGRHYILYRPELFTQFYDEYNQTNDKRTKNNIAINWCEKIIVGMIDFYLDPTCDSFVVSFSAAMKGYGPMMYDIALSVAGDKGLMADRGSVSSAAKKVWNYNFTTRKNEFDFLPLKPLCQKTQIQNSST